MRSLLRNRIAFLRLRLGVTGLLAATGAVATAASVGGFAGRYWWFLDLTSHFRAQYFVVLAVVAAALCVMRAYRMAALFGMMSVINLAFILPLYFSSTQTAPARVHPLRAMLINVYTGNTDHAAVVESIEAHDPDFVILEEVNQRWLDALGPLKQRYPHGVDHPRGDNFGIALLSKHPIVEARIIDIGRIGLPSILALFEVQGASFFILGTHTLPPVSLEYSNRRNEHLAAIPEVVAALDAPTVLLGDLNVSPWSFHFRRLLRDSGLRDASRGRGVQPTWPADLFPLLIPIDHCLYSTGIDILDKSVGGSVGSDHFPVVVDFVADARHEVGAGLFPQYEGRGLATSMAAELVALARLRDDSALVAAQTLPERNASHRILEKLGFVHVTTLDHPEDGAVWEWQLADY